MANLFAGRAERPEMNGKVAEVLRPGTCGSTQRPPSVVPSCLMSNLRLEQCPACASTRIVAVGDGAGTNFRCEVCMRCWHDTFGWLALVDPRSCIDCPRKPDCLRAFALRGIVGTAHLYGSVGPDRHP